MTSYAGAGWSFVLVAVATASAGCSLVVPASRRSSEHDAGKSDASTDAGREAGSGDTGIGDARVPDAGIDGGAMDASSGDAGELLDASMRDTGGETPDAALDDAFGLDAPTAPDACTPVNGYRDGDGDGIGAGAFVSGCAESGLVLVARGDDCNDSRGDVLPGATDELCDGVDADCDGVLDPAEPAVSAACPWRRCATSGATTACDEPVQLVGGGFHTCARLGVSGDLWCWGSNDAGQLGVAAGSDAPMPIRSRYTDVRDACASVAYTCVVLAGRVECFGVGPLSTGAAPWTRDVDAVEVACGYNHVCVRTTTGNVRCAGLNGNAGVATGQVGIPSSMGAGVFPDLVAVPLPSDAVQLALGTNFSCARLSDGTIQCWGADSGILGRGAATTSGVTHVPAPVEAPGVTFVDVVASNYSACARTATSVACWGYALGFQLLDLADVPPFRTAPTTAPGRVFAQLSGGTGHLCGIDAAGTASCWGIDNTFAHGRSPRAATTTSIAAPALPRPGPSALAVDAIALGHADDPAGRGVGGHSCAIERGTGEVWCWGSNNHGQCGAPAAPTLPDAVRVVP